LLPLDTVLQLVINSAVTGAIYALAAAGFTLIFGVLRIAHFAHGDVAMVGAYIAVGLLAAYGAPAGVGSLALVTAAAALACGLLGVAVERLAYRPLRSGPDLQLLIAAIAVSRLLQSLVQLTAGSRIHLIQRPDWRPLELAGAYITPVQLGILALSVAVFAGLHVLVLHTVLGAQIRAVADSPALARSQGVPVERVIGVVFALGSALGAMSGILIGLEVNVTPTMGFALVLKAFAAAVIGGVGSVPGALLGAFLIGAVENVGAWFTGGLWKESMAYTVLLLVLLLKPGGLLGRQAYGEVKL